MKIDATGEVGVVLTEANEPILGPEEKVIGFRKLDYEVYKPALLAKKPIVGTRTAWAWQTRARLIIMDDAWLDLPNGRKGKRYCDIPNPEALDVIHRKGRVLLETRDAEHGRIIFEFRPFGAASRLLAWLKNEKEHRRKRDEGTLASPYRAEDRK